MDTISFTNVPPAFHVHRGFPKNLGQRQVQPEIISMSMAVAMAVGLFPAERQIDAAWQCLGFKRVTPTKGCPKFPKALDQVRMKALVRLLPRHRKEDGKKAFQGGTQGLCDEFKPLVRPSKAVRIKRTA